MEPITADDLILFAAIVEQGSLVATADQLNIPKATLSRRLAHLEEQVGQRLLIRTTRRMVVTEFGQSLLEYAQRISEEVATVQDFIQSHALQPRGVLRLSMVDDYAKHHLSHAIASFIERYPAIQLEIDLSARRVDLIGERFDLAIRMGPLEDDSTLVARQIDTYRFGLYASPIYLALHPAPQHPDALRHHRAIRLLNDEGQIVPWRLLRGREQWEGVPSGQIALNSMSLIQQLVLEGAGIGLLPRRFTEADQVAGRLVALLPEWEPPAAPAWAVMPTRRYLPSKTRLFLDHIQQFK